MVYRGKVQNGVVVLEDGARLEEGQAVSIRPLPARAARTTRRKRRTLYERFKPFIGIIKGLPPDFSSQHEHYLYGTPKRK